RQCGGGTTREGQTGTGAIRPGVSESARELSARKQGADGALQGGSCPYGTQADRVGAESTTVFARPLPAVGGGVARQGEARHAEAVRPACLAEGVDPGGVTQTARAVPRR